ncbi:MAG: phosphatase PAP2 family protein [Bacteroidota bacterium]
MQTKPGRISFCLTGILLILQLNIHAQDDTLAPKPLSTIPRDERTMSVVPDKGYFKSWITDGRDIVIAPYRWNKYQWIALSSVAVVSALLYTQDARIQKIAEKNRNSFMDWASTNGLERLGSGVYTIPALGILYGVGMLTKDEKARYTALKGVEAYLFGFMASQLIKQLTHRHRPWNSNFDPGIWDGPFNSISNSSFPSGHSTIAFAIATVVATSYNKTVWVPVVCYTFAGLVAASRVYQNDHWFSDVFVGSALGFAIGRTIINNHIKKLKVLPVSHTGLGMMLIYQL